MPAALRAGAFYALVVYLIGFATGAVRVLLLVPRFGETAAVALEVPVMLGASWIVAAWSARLFAVSPDLASRAIMGLVAFTVLMAAELGTVIFLFGRPAGDFFTAYASLAGAIGLAAQIAFAAFPALQALGARRHA
jgi:hypothetical protein